MQGEEVNFFYEIIDEEVRFISGVCSLAYAALQNVLRGHRSSPVFYYSFLDGRGVSHLAMTERCRKCPVIIRDAVSR